jgi:hypothetical protein
METAILSVIDFVFNLILDGLERAGLRQPGPRDPRPARTFPVGRDARSRRPLHVIGLALVALLAFGLLFEVAGPGSGARFMFHVDREKLVRAAIDITVTAALMLGLVAGLRRRA